MITKSENKSERFKRIASKRTQNTLEALRKLGNCSNRNIYNYNSEDVAKIFNAVDQELKRIKVLFNTKTKSNTFSL